jgi:hypothetical protein
MPKLALLCLALLALLAMATAALPCATCNAELTGKGVPADDAALICTKALKCTPNAVAMAVMRWSATSKIRTSKARVSANGKFRAFVQAMGAAKYTDCSAAGHLFTVAAVDQNPTPAVKGQTLSINVMGTMSKAAAAITWVSELSFGGQVLFTDSIADSIDAGPTDFTYDMDVPADAPNGVYTFKQAITVDATKEQVFCVSSTFTLA